MTTKLDLEQQQEIQQEQVRWKKAFSDALANWVDVAGKPWYGFRTKFSVAQFFGLSEGNARHIVSGQSITDKAVYAAFFLLTDLSQADPRHLPDSLLASHGQKIRNVRSMSEQEWTTWLANDPLAAKIREHRSRHGHPVDPSESGESAPDPGAHDPVPPAHLQVQPSSPTQTDRTDTDVKELPAPATIPYQFSAGQLLDMLLSTTGTDLAATIAAQTAQQVDAAIAARFDERERFIETTLRVVTTVLPRLQAVVDGMQTAEPATPSASQPELSDDLVERISERSGEKAAEQVIAWLQGELGALKPKRRTSTKPTDQLSIGEMAEALIEQLERLVAPEATPEARDQLEEMFGSQLIKLLSLTELLTLTGKQREEAIQTKHLAGGTL